MKQKNILIFFVQFALLLGSCTSTDNVVEDPPENINSLDAVPTPTRVAAEENTLSKPAESTITASSEPAEINYVPTFEEAVFSFENANLLPPENILPELSSQRAPNGNPGPHFCGALTAPEICDAPDVVDWPKKFCILSQGWEDGENVTITMNAPNGERVVENGEAFIHPINGSDDSTVLPYCYNASFTEMQVGEYTFTFVGESGRLEKHVRVQIPTEPRVFPESKAENEEDIIAFLTGFQPQEPIQLLVYETDLNTLGKSSFVAWGEYTTDNNGRLLIDVPPFPDNGFYSYYVVGEYSGLAHGVNMGYPNLEYNLLTCGFPSRLFPEDQAKGGNMQIRSEPGLSQQVVEEVSAETELTILEGPHCADGIAWWLVSTPDSTEGWLPEYEDDVYLLEPID